MPLETIYAHKSAMILHAIARAQERHDLTLTEADIEQLSAQYRTPELTIVASDKRIVTPIAARHGHTTRTICWAEKYECYVVFDEAVHVIITFLPRDYVPDQATPQSVLFRRPAHTTSTIRNRMGEKIVQLAAHGAKKKKKKVVVDEKLTSEDWFTRIWRNSRKCNTPKPEKEAQLLLRLAQEAIVEWYCQVTGAGEWFLKWDSDTPSRLVILPDGERWNAGQFYKEHRDEIQRVLHQRLGLAEEFRHEPFHYAHVRAWRHWKREQAAEAQSDSASSGVRAATAYSSSIEQRSAVASV